ncbi:MAG TPA: nucleotidyl transferase AbiEii/AbiGii toxin family protein [Thermoleophilaceae bacterium]
MSIGLLERAGADLGALVDEVVFVGGATLALWITDPGAPPIRPTKDVDVIVEVTTRGGYYEFEERLRAASFAPEGSVICRWIQRDTALIVDAMPADPAILGFSNRWQRAALPFAAEVQLLSGARIRAVPPPFLLATKVEAFGGRGQDDFLGSRDFADIVSLVDGREQIVDEVRTAPPKVRSYLADELSSLMSRARFAEGVSAQLPPDEASQERADLVVAPRLRAIIDAA